jgi:fumarate reductase subunit D
MSRARNHPAYWAFVAHRLSGVALALFLPLHFLMLGLALEGAAALDAGLVYTDLPLVKAAEWGLVMLLSVHLLLGLRLLVLELFPWRSGEDARTGLVFWSAGGALAAGLVFLAGVM